MKKIIIITSTLLLAGIVVYLLSAHYEISDITADNFRQKLHVLDSKSLASQRYLGDPDVIPAFILFSCNNVGSNEFWQSRSDTFTDKSGYTRHITNVSRGIDYALRFPHTQSDLIDYISIGEAEFRAGIPNADATVATLVKDCQCEYKKTELKRGEDILIRDNGDNFLIVQLLTNKAGMQFMWFQLYSKKKWW